MVYTLFVQLHGHRIDERSGFIQEEYDLSQVNCSVENHVHTSFTLIETSDLFLHPIHNICDLLLEDLRRYLSASMRLVGGYVVNRVENVRLIFKRYVDEPRLNEDWREQFDPRRR